MSQRIKIDWAEMRRRSDQTELYFVEATEHADGWAFRECSTWEIRWFAVPTSERLVMIAERGKSSVLRGTLRSDGDIYLRAIDVGLWCGTKNEYPVLGLGVWLASTALAMIRFRNCQLAPA